MEGGNETTNLLLPNQQHQFPQLHENLTQIPHLHHLLSSTSPSPSPRRAQLIPPSPPPLSPPPGIARTALQLHPRILHSLDINTAGFDTTDFLAQVLDHALDLGFEGGEIAWVFRDAWFFGFGGVDGDGVFGGAFAALFFEGVGCGGEGVGWGLGGYELGGEIMSVLVSGGGALGAECTTDGGGG